MKPPNCSFCACDNACATPDAVINTALRQIAASWFEKVMCYVQHYIEFCPRVSETQCLIAPARRERIVLAIDVFSLEASGCHPDDVLGLAQMSGRGKLTKTQTDKIIEIVDRILQYFGIMSAPGTLQWPLPYEDLLLQIHHQSRNQDLLHFPFAKEKQYTLNPLKWNCSNGHLHKCHSRCGWNHILRAMRHPNEQVRASGPFSRHTLDYVARHAFADASFLPDFRGRPSKRPSNMPSPRLLRDMGVVLTSASAAASASQAPQRLSAPNHASATQLHQDPFQLSQQQHAVNTSTYSRSVSLHSEPRLSTSASSSAGSYYYGGDSTQHQTVDGQGKRKRAEANNQFSQKRHQSSTFP